MKKDYTLIQSMKEQEKEAQREFLEQNLEKIQNKILSFSFLPQSMELVEQASLDALFSYQEDTPTLFSFYLTKKVIQTLNQHAKEYMQENKIPISLETFRYYYFKKVKEKETGSSIFQNQICEMLSFSYSKVFQIQEEFKTLQKTNPKLYDTLLEKETFTVVKEKKKVSPKKEENLLTESESQILGLYLGSKDEICMDINEIARFLHHSEESIQKTLRKAFQKTKEDKNAKEAFLRRYPSCESLYDVRIASILPSNTSSSKKGKMKVNPKPKERTKQKTLTPSDVELAFLKTQLKRDAHGFFMSQREVAKNLNQNYTTICSISTRVMQKIENPSYLQAVEQEILNFQILWEEFLDHREKNKLSKRQLQILNLEYFEENGMIKRRSDQEIAECLSTEILHFDSTYVQKGKKSIRDFFKIHEESTSFFENYNQMKMLYQKQSSSAFKKKKTQKTNHLPSNIELAFLKAQLERNEQGFFMTQNEIAKNLNQKYATIRSISTRVMKKIENPSYLQAVEQEIPNFQILWEEFLDHREKKKLSKRQLQILNLEYFEENGIIKRRSDQEIAELLSTEILHFDSVYVQKEKKKMMDLFRAQREVNFLFEDYNRMKNLYKKQTLTPSSVELTFLKTQLKRDEHGFFMSQKEIAKYLNQKYETILSISTRVMKKIENPSYLKAVEQEILNFQILWEEFLDHREKNKLSKRQLQILNLEYFEENRIIKRRSNQEIAECLSTEILHFDSTYVQKVKKSIKDFLKTHKEAASFFENYNQMKMLYQKQSSSAFKNKKTKQTNHLPSNIELAFLKAQLERNEHGFFMSQKEISKSLNQKYETILSISTRVMKKIENPSYLQAVEQEIPNFQVLWEEFLDNREKKKLSKRQLQILNLEYFEKNGMIKRRSDQEIAELLSTEILHFDSTYVEKVKKCISVFLCNHKDIVLEDYNRMKNLYKKQTLTPSSVELTFLKTQLKRDEHGFFMSQKEIAKYLNQKYETIFSISTRVMKKIENPSYLKAVEQEIPDFQILWEELLDSKTKKALSKRQLQILNLEYFEENGMIKRRSNQEIAECLSTEILHFDSTYVQKAKNSISVFHRNHKDIVFEDYDRIKMKTLYKKQALGKTSSKKQKNLTPSDLELSFLKVQLERDEHGFFMTQNEIAKNLKQGYKTVFSIARRISTKIENPSYLQALEQEIPNFQILWEELLDSKTKKALSKRQLQILNLCCSEENATIKRRSNQEIAECLSTELLHFDSIYVEKQLNKAKKFLKQNKEDTNYIETLKQEVPNLQFLTEKKAKSQKSSEKPKRMSLTLKDLKYLQNQYRFHSSKKRYLTEEEQAKKLNISPEKLETLKANLEEKLKNSSVQKQLEENYPEFEEDKAIFTNYQTISVDEQTVNAIQKVNLQQGILHFYVAKQEEKEERFSALETSIFQDFISCCSESQKMILALRLGYFDNCVHSTKEIAQLFQIDPQEVTLLTKSCLEAGKQRTESFTFSQNHPQKRKVITS